MIYCDSCSIECDYDEVDDEGRCSECAPCGECNGWGCEECGDNMSVWDVFLNLALFCRLAWTPQYPYGFEGQKQFIFKRVIIYGDRVVVSWYNEYKWSHSIKKWFHIDYMRDEIKEIPRFFDGDILQILEHRKITNRKGQ